MSLPRTLRAALVVTGALSLFPSSAPAAGEPVNRAAPQVTQTGRNLSTTDGSWAGQTQPFTYEWLRCATLSLESCNPIAGATQPTYVISRADLGSRIRSRVTASNRAGSAKSASEPTGVVEERLFPAPPAPPEPKPSFLTPRPVVVIAGLRRGRLTLVDEFVVRGPAGAIVRVRCSGKRCPVRRLSTTIGARGRLRLRRAQGTYMAGAVLEIRVIDEDAARIGKYTRVKFRGRSMTPLRTDSCLRPGASRPSACP